MEGKTDYNPVLASLHQMHRTFSELMERVNGGVRQIRALEQHIKELKKAQEVAVKTVLNQRIALDGKQAQLENNEKSIERRKVQLDEAKNDREFNAIQDQIAAAEVANAVLSDEILEGLDYLDSLKQKAENAKEAVQKAETQLETRQAQSQQDREEAENEIRHMKVDFRATEAKLDGEHRMMYQRIYAQKRFDMLAPVEGRCCSGCHTSIPVEKIGQIVGSERAVECPLCGRMLYVRGNFHI